MRLAMTTKQPLSWRLFVAQTLVATLLSAGIIGKFVQVAIDNATFTRSWQQRALAEVVVTFPPE